MAKSVNGLEAILKNTASSDLRRAISKSKFPESTSLLFLDGKSIGTSADPGKIKAGTYRIELWDEELDIKYPFSIPDIGLDSKTPEELTEYGISANEAAPRLVRLGASLYSLLEKKPLFQTTAELEDKSRNYKEEIMKKGGTYEPFHIAREITRDYIPQDLNLRDILEAIRELYKGRDRMETTVSYIPFSMDSIRGKVAVASFTGEKDGLHGMIRFNGAELKFGDIGLARYKKKIGHLFDTVTKLERDLMQAETSLDDKGFIYTISAGAEGNYIFRISKRPYTEPEIRLERLMGAYNSKKISISDLMGKLTQDLLVHYEEFETKGIKGVKTGATPSGSGLAIGTLILDSAEKINELAKNQEFILVSRRDDSDIGKALYDKRCVGYINPTASKSHHYVILAGNLNIPVLHSSPSLKIDNDEMQVSEGEEEYFNDFDTVSVDFGNSLIYPKKLKVIKKENKGLEKLFEIIKENQSISVYVNADSPKKIREALENGARGIGLCRTERMFYHPPYMQMLQRIILSAYNCNNEKHKIEKHSMKKDLSLLGKYLSDAFLEMYSAADGLPVVIRLLDPPLHEFIKRDIQEYGWNEFSYNLGVCAKCDKPDFKTLEEANPALGLRGVRVGIERPEIYKAQIGAIMTAAARAKKEGKKVIPQILIPFVNSTEEINIIRGYIEEMRQTAESSYGIHIDYKIRAMIETPAALSRMPQIAEAVDGISFGTNDLTQAWMGLDRETADSIGSIYSSRGISIGEPFSRLDEGLIREMELRIDETREKIKKSGREFTISVCGEQAAHEIGRLHNIGIDYVSISPGKLDLSIIESVKLRYHG